MWKCGERQVYLSTLTVDCQGIHCPTSEKASLNSKKKDIIVQSRMRIARNSKFTPIVVLFPLI